MPELAQGPCDECDKQLCHSVSGLLIPSQLLQTTASPKTCDKRDRLLITEEDVWKQEVGKYVLVGGADVRL